MIRTVAAIRYVTALREGGSLPAVVEADDDGTYVVKFRGAGQGARALIAELVAGEIGRALGLPVPEIVLIELDPVLGRSEPDGEIQSLLKASAGLNLALDFLPGALAYTPYLNPPAPDLASLIVWFDAFVTNVDRTPRNANLLRWGQRLWLIDHGAALYIHHSWHEPLVHSKIRFPQIRDHILLPFATRLTDADAFAASRLSAAVVEAIAGLIPEEWLGDEPRFASLAEHRAAYSAYLLRRLETPRAFVEEAVYAHAQLI